MNRLFELKTVYGIHLSRCFEASLGIDPLLSPKKCSLNCIFCPLGETIVKTIKPSIYVDLDRVIRDLMNFIDKNGLIFKTTFVWGLGDPLLNYQTPVIVEKIHSLLKDMGFNGRIVVRTSGVLINSNWIKPVFKYVDENLVPIALPYSYWKIFTEPVGDFKFNNLVNSLKNIVKEYGDKLAIELVVFRYRDFTNAEESVLDELISVIHSTRVEKIYVKTINRPGRSIDIKPVRGELFNRVVEKMNNEGFKTIVCSDVSVNKLNIVDKTNILLNHILRKPLSTDEIIQIYGPESLKILEKSFVSKINWDNKIYFKLKSIR